MYFLVERDRTKNHQRGRSIGPIRFYETRPSDSSRIQPEVIIYTDEEPIFYKYFRINEIQHEKVNPRKKRYVIKEIYHIQNVNAYHERLKNLVMF